MGQHKIPIVSLSHFLIVFFMDDGTVGLWDVAADN